MLEDTNVIFLSGTEANANKRRYTLWHVYSNPTHLSYKQRALFSPQAVIHVFSMSAVY